ncbi:protein-tyrosine phosphatase-like protein [Limtongia smithiae]|uniref:protein-tyrosine phosphatase-like protein n=1 Tax=Limtongia smithiae TaxID=1125753 RepID=UPI0034CD0905
MPPSAADCASVLSLSPSSTPSPLEMPGSSSPAPSPQSFRSRPLNFAVFRLPPPSFSASSGSSSATSLTSIPSSAVFPPTPATVAREPGAEYSFFNLPPTTVPVSQKLDGVNSDASDDLGISAPISLAPSLSFSSIASTNSTRSSFSCSSESDGCLSISPVSSAQSNCATPMRSFSTTSFLRMKADANAAEDLNAILPLCPSELGMMLASTPDNVVVFDVRPYAQYAVEHIRGAVNLCVPSTLLRRPGFTVPKILDSLAAEDMEKAAAYMSASSVVIYDSSSVNLTVTSSAFLTARKFFTCPEFEGSVYYKAGGLCAFASRYQNFIEESPAPSPAASKKSACDSKCMPILSGLRLPMFSKKQPPVNPFFSNIRQNMDLIGGVGEPIPVRVPSACSAAVQKKLPLWLQQVISPVDGAKKIADRFLDIERAEKGRLEMAFSSSCTITTAAPSTSQCALTSLFQSSSTSNTPTPTAESARFSISAALERGTKNRYNNIFPYDHTRVRLASCAPGSCDYINASYVQASGSVKRYIATQGPLPDTFADFWSVVWDQKVRVIVMLTPVMEGGQVKCDSYWKETRYGALRLTLLSDEEVKLTSETNTIVRIRKFTLANVSDVPREITHIQYVSWPDLGAPADPKDIVALSELSTRCNAGGESDISAALASHPVVVHCSAGCGRTGTFCTVDSAIDILARQSLKLVKNEGMDDLINQVVSDLRTQRLSMVQCLRQYVICYECVLEWEVQQVLKGGVISLAEKKA